VVRASDPSVVRILQRRVARGSRPPHDDGARVALVIEGGAMRGVISAGMVSAMEELGLAGVFDAVYGSSAGAINGAYFLAGQAAVGTRIYYEDINNRRFIDLRRAVRGRAIVDLGFLLDDVAVHRKRLDVGRLLDARPALSVMATDVETERAVTLAGFDAPAGLFSALRAGATMPVIAGAPHVHEGRRYLDASLTEPIAVPTAERDGHTHVVALLTRDGGMRSRPSAFDRYFVGPQLRRLSPGLADRYLSRAGPYAALMTVIAAGTGPLGRAQVVGISVPGLQISKLERRPGILQQGARLGYDAAMAAFGSVSP
jgi:predicted patatin/cPLA2 family phospholipase